MRVAVLAGGVGGARLARGLGGVAGVAGTVVGNVGDDEIVYGLRVSPDLDTLVYTLAGVEGPHGWGRAADGTRTMSELARFGLDTSFAIGDLDLATNLYRTARLAAGATLGQVTAEVCAAFGVTTPVIPATDDRLRTRIQTRSGEWLAFQDYFVRRRHRDPVAAVDYDGAGEARPARGVIKALTGADVVVIAPSNPPLSILPILAVPGIREAVAAAPRVVGVSPLFGGKALKGPAAEVLAGLGHPPGNAGVIAAYGGLLTDLVVDVSDDADAAVLTGARIHPLDTRMPDRPASDRFVRRLLELIR